MSNLQSQISNIQSALQAVYPKDEAASLAWWIMEEETGLTRSQLLCGCKDTTNFANMQKIQTIIDRLLHFEPIQYIFGHTLWNGLDLKVTPATLIPRPETAELVERINLKSEILNLKSQIHVLDVGTGSGCIAISLKKAHPEWHVTGIDISTNAIEVAKENARRNKVDVNFQVADIFSDQMTKYLNKWYMVNDPMVNEKMANDQMVNIVVSNPPYICESEKSSMRPNVLNFEPSSALFVPDNDPLLFYRRIAELFSLPLQGKGRERGLFFEINEAYGPQLSAMLGGLGYTNIQIHKDIYGKQRFIEGRMAR
ncbi:MAG: peptide chain release factor N(5)-glutamine methyltransferase [Paludibacteraceae bacterium]|nr:peptide chain release factor N(5)-glutamine methyltransferase [Paludibacteraceae bacterium]